MPMVKTIIYSCVFFFCVCCQSVSADQLFLKNGDVLNATVVEESDTFLVVVHESLGRLKISKGEVTSRKEAVSVPDEKTGPQTETYYFAKNEPEFDRLNAFAKKMKEDGWKMSANFSVQADDGEDDEMRYRAGFKASRETLFRRFNTDWTYYYKEKNGSNTDNKLSAGLRYDWLKPDSPWFHFLGGRYDYDKFESWEHRLSVHTGPGYRLIDNDLMQWEVSVGGGFRKEWQSENNDVLAEGIGSTGFSWKLSERQSVAFSWAYYPVFDDWQDYRTRTTADWNYLLSREMNLSFTVGLLHEYQAIIDPGEDHNDTRLYSGVQVDF